MCVCIYLSLSRERHAHNYVLVFHTKRPSSFSAREDNRMRSLTPLVCLPVLICMVSQVYVCCIPVGWHVHAHMGKYMLSPISGWNQGHRAAAASPLLGYWTHPPDIQNTSRIFCIF